MAQTMIQQIANRYQILSLIGQGGMADVYRAKDKILDAYRCHQSFTLKTE